jgi:hypothetical protein
MKDTKKNGKVGENGLEQVTNRYDEDVLMLIRNPLKLEQILTEARIPEIIKRISKTSKTIIYTEYVDQIL